MNVLFENLFWTDKTSPHRFSYKYLLLNAYCIKTWIYQHSRCSNCSKSPQIYKIFGSSTQSTLVRMKTERMNWNLVKVVIKFSHQLGLNQIPNIDWSILGTWQDSTICVVKDRLDPVSRIILVSEVLLKHFSSWFVEKPCGLAGSKADLNRIVFF